MGSGVSMYNSLVMKLGDSGVWLLCPGHGPSKATLVKDGSEEQELAACAVLRLI